MRQSKVALMSVFIALLSGCGPRIVAQTPSSIVLGDVLPDINSGTAFEIAQSHCQKSGRNAKLASSQRSDGYYTYECIE